MSEDKKIQKENKPASTEKVVEKVANTNKGAAKVVARSVYGAKRRVGRRVREERRDEFDQRILDIARVTRVMAGGKRMRFRVCIVIGDKKGKVGVGIGKGTDVALGVNKAVNKAKKDLITVPLVNKTIPHEIYQKLGAAKILFKPATKGKGILAGGVVRVILEMAGVPNISSKILGTNNKINNALCTIEALKNLRSVDSKDNKENNNKEKPAELKK